VEQELKLGEDEVFVGTQEALASHLNADRKSIQRWSKKPDCPGKVKGGFNLTAWRAFMEKNGLGRKVASKNKTDLEAEKIALGNEKLRLVNEKLRGEVMSGDEVVKVLGEMVAGFVLQLNATKHTIAEETVGLPVGEAVKRVDRRHKEALESLALGSWAQKKTFWSKVFVALSDLHKIHGLGPGARIMSSTPSET
jgi:hypothetical protein